MAARFPDLNMNTPIPILTGLLYAFKRGCVSAYSMDSRRFRYLTPASDWQDSITTGDVWLCDVEGSIDPGNNVSPVPVARAAIGRLVGRCPADASIVSLRLRDNKFVHFKTVSGTTWTQSLENFRLGRKPGLRLLSGKEWRLEIISRAKEEDAAPPPEQ